VSGLDVPSLGDLDDKRQEGNVKRADTRQKIRGGEEEGGDVDEDKDDNEDSGGSEDEDETAPDGEGGRLTGFGGRCTGNSYNSLGDNNVRHSNEGRNAASFGDIEDGSMNVREQTNVNIHLSRSETKPFTRSVLLYALKAPEGTY